MVKKEDLNKFKNRVNQVLNSPMFVLIIGVLIFFKTIFFYNNTIAINEPAEFDTILGTISFIAVIVSVISILPNRARIWTAIIINLLLSILLFADNIYYSFSSNVLSVAQLDNLQYGGEIMKTLPSLLEWKQLLYFIDIIIMLLLIIFKEIKIVKTKERGKKFAIIKSIYAILAILVFLFVSMDYVNEGIKTSYNKDLQIRNATIYGYHISDIINETNIANKAKYKNYNDFKNNYDKFKQNSEKDYGTLKYDFEGLAKDKNIIVVQLESVQEFVINKTINGKEITPNINKFLHENIEFTNMHMQSYSTTADSEHTMMTSTFPMENGMSFAKYFTNTYDDIFKIYNENDYHTSYMHGNYPYFWNRGNVYGRLKLDKTEFKEEFEDCSEDINGDLSDELLYIQAVDKMKEYRKPFFTEVVSASSHTPFTLEGLQDRSKITIDVGKYKDTYFGNFIESMNYADYAFGKFIDKLKQENLYDDSVILIYGDHNGLSMYDEEMLDFLKQLNPDLNDIQIKLNYTRVACGLKIPGISKLKINKMINKLDIKPTMAYLSGLEDGISLGTNMFASKNYVCLNNERIITDKYYFDGNWYEIETGKMLDLNNINDNLKQELQKYEKEMHEQIDLSISLSINNLLASR
ncbi:MAG: sulfatase-like hydrolase/transferase [Clostridia bacterium]|nr:sulfatase-like hydrolase/transferase [Clostridia bacterium]